MLHKFIRRIFYECRQEIIKQDNWRKNHKKLKILEDLCVRKIMNPSSDIKTLYELSNSLKKFGPLAVLLNIIVIMISYPSYTVIPTIIFIFSFLPIVDIYTKYDINKEFFIQDTLKEINRIYQLKERKI